MMTTRERFLHMFRHEEADRVPFWDYAWGTTIDRWMQEGLPTRDYAEYFGLDRFGYISPDNSPQYPVQTLEETEAYTIHTTKWGVTLKTWKHMTSTPEFIDFKIVDPASWAEAKARMKPTPDRINWEALKRDYPRWKAEGRLIQGSLWFGFDVTHSWAVGTERLLMALVEDPEWCQDMFNHYLDVNLALLDMAWDAGYRFDTVYWPDDMGYKQNQFFSKNTYRNLLKPVHKRACDWAHNKGVYVHLHSCGFIEPFIPDIIEAGVDILNPLEVKAGMDPCRIKQTFGDRLTLHGGLNAVLWDDKDAVIAEMERIFPAMKQNGGFIFASDHSIPDSVSFENFKAIVDAYKRLSVY